MKKIICIGLIVVALAVLATVAAAQPTTIVMQLGEQVQISGVGCRMIIAPVDSQSISVECVSLQPTSTPTPSGTGMEVTAIYPTPWPTLTPTPGQTATPPAQVVKPPIRLPIVK